MDMKAGHLDLKHIETILYYDRELEFLAKDKDGVLYIAMMFDMGNIKNEWLIYKVSNEDYDKLYDSIHSLEWLLTTRNEIMRKALPDFWLMTEPFGENEMTIEIYTPEQLEEFIKEYGTLTESDKAKQM